MVEPAGITAYSPYERWRNCWKREHIANHNEYNIDNLQFTDTDVRCVVMPPERSLDIDTLTDFNMVQEAMKLMK